MLGILWGYTKMKWQGRYLQGPLLKKRDRHIFRFYGIIAKKVRNIIGVKENCLLQEVTEGLTEEVKLRVDGELEVWCTRWNLSLCWVRAPRRKTECMHSLGGVGCEFQVFKYCWRVEWGGGMSGKEILGEVCGVCQRFCMYYSHSKSWLNIQRPWPGSHGC